jgi:tRNA(Ile2) C34 agmatinyltransferase TiaS
MNEKQINFIEKLKETKPLMFFKFIDETRKLYNQLCPSCQEKTIKAGGKVEIDLYCEKCKNKAEYRLDKQKKILEDAGAKFS